ncbi:MAG: hypothetical protein LIO44_02045 [Eubacterium sp.]|nr:hypothetical protein [Eubacterium sp.]
MAEIISALAENLKGVEGFSPARLPKCSHTRRILPHPQACPKRKIPLSPTQFIMKIIFPLGRLGEMRLAAAAMFYSERKPQKYGLAFTNLNKAASFRHSVTAAFRFFGKGYANTKKQSKKLFCRQFSDYILRLVFYSFGCGWQIILIAVGNLSP